MLVETRSWEGAMRLVTLLTACLWLTIHPTAVHAAQFIYNQEKNEAELSGEMKHGLVSRIPRGATVRIVSTPGGSLPSVTLLRNHRVIIDGQCASACFWLFVTSKRVCYTERAEFSPHAWHRVTMFDENGMISHEEIETRNAEKTKRWLQLVREPVRQHLERLPNTSDVIEVSLELIQEAYPEKACRDSDRF